MSGKAGGRANLGYTELDQKNYLRTRRQMNLIYGEAGCLLKYFQEQSVKNQLFRYAVQLDSEEQITNIFWVDARMIIGYAYFGDIMTFDTTCNDSPPMTQYCPLLAPHIRLPRRSPILGLLSWRLA
jgi:hypothetical protein